jgi:hypothetical protein
MDFSVAVGTALSEILGFDSRFSHTSLIFLVSNIVFSDYLLGEKYANTLHRYVSATVTDK